MKTKILLLLLTLSFSGFSQSHVWQDSLANYKAKQMGKGWGWWDSFSPAIQQNKVLKWYMLQWKADKEIRSNQIADSIANDTAVAGNRQRYITRLMAKGYQANNSLFDWKKLYNHPEIFGVNWLQDAQYQKSISPGIDYFISQWLVYKQSLSE